MNTLEKVLLGLVAAGLLMASASNVFLMHANDSLKAGAFNPTSAGTYRLQNSITNTQSTIPLSSFTEPGSNTPYTMTYLNSDIEYGTISPDTANPVPEFVSFTGITQNTNGSATLTGVTRGLSRTPGNTGCVASTTLSRGWASQTSFILSNSACFYGEFATKRNAQTINGLWTFSSTSPPKLDYDPTSAQWALFSSSSLVTYHLLQTTSFSGTTDASFTAKGIVQVASSTVAASSTRLGTSGALNVLAASYATDTPQTCSGLKTGGCVVMSNLLGKISQAWIDFTATFSWSGLNTFSGGLWSNASTTLAASDTTTHALTLNGIPYKFPPAQSASSTVLSTNGSGALSWVTISPARYVATMPAGTGNAVNGYATSTTGVTIPAGFMQASSTLQVRAAFTCGSDANATPGTCYFFLRNGTTGAEIATVSAAAAANSGGTVSATVDCIIFPTTPDLARETYSCSINGAALGGSNTYFAPAIGLAQGTDGQALSDAVPLSVVVRSDSTHATAAASAALIIVQQ